MGPRASVEPINPELEQSGRELLYHISKRMFYLVRY
jgi:hypothetical protein